MKKYNGLALAGLAFLTMTVAACSDDDDFTSRPPVFNAFTVKKLQAASGTLDDGVFRVGDKVLVTLVQSRKGHLLNKVTYAWTSVPEAVHAYTNLSVYDAQPVSPTDTIRLTSAGWHTVQLSARYSVSGQGANGASSYNVAGGGSVSVSTSTLYVNLTASGGFAVSDSLE